MRKNLLLLCCALLPSCFSAQIYDIYAIKFGERRNYVWMADQAVGYSGGDSTKVYFMYWVLKSKNKVILVDAGFTDDAGIDTSKITFTRPDKLLPSIGINPGDVTDIIVTHPHWDHVGGIDLYPQAMVWMQEADYNDFVKKRDPEASGFNKKDIQKIRDRKTRGTLTLLKGLRDEVIIANVTVFISGSQHTAGSQYVMANNGKQNVVIASDNCKYYRNITDMLPSPATTDQKAYVRTMRTMKGWVDRDTDLVIPGHDPLVFSKFKSVAKDVAEIKK